MNNFDPYTFIEHVMNDMLDCLSMRYLSSPHLNRVHYVAVLAYGCSQCVVIPQDKFVILQNNDVLGMYSQSIPIPTVADWLCYELQEPFGEEADLAALAIAYFTLLDNNRLADKKVVNPSMVQSDLLRYSLFYYLLRVDTNMDRWVMMQVREHCANRVTFVYKKTLHYLILLSQDNRANDFHHGEILPTDNFLESFHPMIKIVTTYVLSDFKASLDIY